MHKLLLAPLAAAALLVAGCGGAPPATENYGPVPITGPVSPAVPNPKLNTKPLSVPRAQPLTALQKAAKKPVHK